MGRWTRGATQITGDDLMGPFGSLRIFPMVPARFCLVDLVAGGFVRASKNGSDPVAIRSFVEAFGAPPERIGFIAAI